MSSRTSPPVNPFPGARRKIEGKPPRRGQKIGAKSGAQHLVARPPRKPKFVTMTLTVQHRINGAPYGPGVVRVSPEMARAFQEGEYHAHQEEQRFRGEYAAVIGPRGRVTQVAPEKFDEEIANISPTGRY